MSGPRRIAVPDLIGGIALGALGLYFLVGAVEYGLGTARRMGAGYFPMVVAVLALAVAAILGATAFRRSVRVPSIAWRPLLAVLGGIAAFGLGIERFGLVPATFVATVVTALGDRAARPLSVLVSAVVIALGAWIVFTLGLGLTIPAFKVFV